MSFRLKTLSLFYIMSFGVAGLLCFVLTLDAHAQDANNLQNIPTELQEKEIKYRGFLIKPKIRVEMIHDDNIFSEPENTTSDFISRITPSLNVVKEYNGHIFEAGGEYQAERFLENSSENAEGYRGYFRGNLQANSRWEFPFSVEYFNKVRSRNRPDNARATTERTSIERLSTEAGFKRTFNRLSVKLLGLYSNQAFEDGIARDTGAPVIFSDRDNKIVGAFLGLEYALIGQQGAVPDSAIFAHYRISQQSFSSDGKATGNGVVITSDNVSQNVLLGYKTSIKDRLFLEVGAGIIQRDFEPEGIDDAVDYDVYADISYLFTPKLSIQLKASRDRDDSNDLLVGVLRSQYEARLFYEIYHDIYSESALIYEDFSYDQENISDVNDITLSTGLNFIHNPAWRSGVRFDYTQRSSDDANKEYDSLQALIHITKSF